MSKNNYLIQDADVFYEGALKKLKISIIDGVIEAIAEDLQPKEGQSVLSLKSLTVLPGIIDTQVHFREPGLEYKETLAEGAAAALQGGVTGFFEMPNTKPATDSAIALRDKVDRISPKAWTHYAFYLGSTENNLDQLSKLETLKTCCGIKTFVGSSTGSLLIHKVEHLEKLFQNFKHRAAFHCEDESRIRARIDIAKKAAHPSAHPLWRDEESAFLATQTIVGLAKKYDRPVHILHVTTAKEMNYLRQEKKNHPITVEVTPQHLTLEAPECYEKWGTLAQMNPPIRERRHKEALWEGVADGTVDIIGSDHAPHTWDEKQKPYPASPSGMPGVQTILPLMLSHVKENKLSLSRMVDLLSLNPVSIFGIKNLGPLQPGRRADLSVVDLSLEKTLETKDLFYKCGWSPFVGYRFKAWPVLTMISGHISMRDGEFLGSPQGQSFEFNKDRD